jgi:putative ABC transport system ATP-binding protein
MNSTLQHDSFLGLANTAKPSSAPTLIRTEHLTKTYTDGQVKALFDVSLEIRQGEYLSIMGPSGSGKSTLLNMLGALDRPTSGEIYFEDQPLTKIRNLDRLRAQKIGFVFQSFYLLPVLTAVENVQVPMFEGTLSIVARVKKATELLEVVGLAHRVNHQPQQLSVGERQRVAVARALANDPLLLLADEPTGNLDSKSANGIFELFAKLHEEQGMTIVLITHDDALGRRAPRIVRMQDGRLRSDEYERSSVVPAPTIAKTNGDTPRPHVPRAKSILPPFALPRD